jgi:mannitol/fructose-specific phosphotransferase system IIA component (Ntr-type)
MKTSMWQNNFTFLSGLSDRDWLARLIIPQHIVINLSSDCQQNACRELIDTIIPADRQSDRELCLHDVLEREKISSTFLGHGVALPHGITNGTNTLKVAIGIKAEGFASSDGENMPPVQIILLCICPAAQRRNYLHFTFLSANILLLEGNRADLLTAKTPEQVREIMLRV